MSIRKTIIAAAIIMAAANVSAQNKSAGINLSLWKGVSTQPLNDTQSTYVNIGFLSSMNRLSGIGINALAGVTRGNMNGLQASGLANVVGGSMRGVQLSGISNISGNNLVGFSAAGLVNITGNQAKGVILSGLTSIGGDNTSGLMISGCMNVTGNTASGMQLSGLSNITGETFDGVMTAGFLNVAGEKMNGWQMAGLANIAGKALNGIQIGTFNYATQAHGVQIGLINYYKDEMKGLQLGLVNANPHTKVQVMAYSGNAMLFNVGARFKNELFYTILGIGMQDRHLNDQFSASVSYRAGLSFHLYKGLSLSGDLGYQHIETFKNNDEVIPKHLYALQARVNLEYQFTKKFGIFATGGYGGSRYYNQSRTYDKGAIVEAGVILF